MEQQNARLPEQISREFAKAVKPLLDVHRSATRKSFGPTSGPARAPLLPLAAQPSHMGKSTDSSGAPYATANVSVSEAVESHAAEVVGGERDWLSELREDVERHIAQKPQLKMNINLSTGTVSRSSSAPSPMLKHKGKDMTVLKAAIAMENEKCTEVGKGKTPGKGGKQKVVPLSSSSSSPTTSSSEGEQRGDKRKATPKGNGLRRRVQRE